MKRLMAVGLAAVSITAQGVTVFGAEEHVNILNPPGIEVTAELKPHVSRSTLRVENMKYRLGSDGGMWVHFTVDSGDLVVLDSVTMDRPIEKDNLIPQRDGSLLHVPTVNLNVCIGSKKFRLPFQLRERKGYTAPMTLGEDAIKQIGSVDPNASFLHEPDCSLSDDDSGS